MKNKYQMLAGNTVKLGLGTFGSKLLVFLMVRFYTEFLSPADYGTADLITQTANLLIPLVSLGITDAVFRFAMDEAESTNDVFTTGFRVIAAGCAVLALAAAVGGTVFSHGVWLIAVFMAASNLHTLCAQFLRARGEMTLFAVQGLTEIMLYQVKMMSIQSTEQKIEIGYRTGMITVEAATQQRRQGYIVWRCRCDCGGEILLDTRALQRGTITDCGCKTRVKPGQTDITGRHFGQLTAQYPLPERTASGGMRWHCQCSCGGQIDAPLPQLTSGYRKSCGCLSHPSRKDYIGTRFSHLTVIDYAGKVNGQHMWRCRCDCGAETIVRQTYLQSGKTKSCGCLQKTQILRKLKFSGGTSVTILEAGRKRLLRSNTSGVTGVYQNRHSGRWCAQITFRGKTRYLGSFENKADAVAARRNAEQMFDVFLAQYYAAQNRTT